MLTGYGASLLIISNAMVPAMHAAGRDGGREASQFTRALRGSRPLERAHGTIGIRDGVRMSVHGWSILSLSRAYTTRVHPLS